MKKNNLIPIVIPNHPPMTNQSKDNKTDNKMDNKNRNKENKVVNKNIKGFQNCKESIK